VGNGGRAKLWLTPRVRIASAEHYSDKRLGTIIDIANAHDREWLEAWQAFFG